MGKSEESNPNGAFAGRFSVDGQLIDSSQLTVRSMNFGQHWRTPNVVDYSYSVSLPKEFFVKTLITELPELVTDCQLHPNFDEPFENALRAADWPDAHAVSASVELAAMALKWFAHDMLLDWFGDGRPQRSPAFVINTIDSLSFHGPHPNIVGKARSANVAVQYQDT